MLDLIKALNIFLEYGNPDFPTQCLHDKLIVTINPSHVSDEDKAALAILTFYPDDGEYHFFSTRFGSA